MQSGYWRRKAETDSFCLSGEQRLLEVIQGEEGYLAFFTVQRHTGTGSLCADLRVPCGLHEQKELRDDP